MERLFFWIHTKTRRENCANCELVRMTSDLPRSFCVDSAHARQINGWEQEHPGTQATPEKVQRCDHPDKYSPRLWKITKDHRLITLEKY